MNNPDSVDDALDRLAAQNPASKSDVEATVSGEQRAAVRQRAMAAHHAHAGERGRPGHPIALRLAAVAVIAAVGVTIAMALGGARGGGPEYASAAVEVAEANPRIIVTAPGWSIASAAQFDPQDGQVVFSDGSSDLELTWYPARLYDQYLADRADIGNQTPVSALGLDATMVQYQETDIATLLPPQGRVFVEIRGDLGSEQAYLDVLGSMQTTDVDTWLAAMPESVLQPSEQEQLVSTLLDGVPLPPGFDLDRLRTEPTLDSATLANNLSSAVACGWLDSWAAADRDGNAASASLAVTVMSSADQWPVLKSALVRRDRIELIREYARQISSGHLDQEFGDPSIVKEDGTKIEFGPQYASSLGCASMSKRVVQP